MSQQPDKQEAAPAAGSQIEQGAYEVLRGRLVEQTRGLRLLVDQLNQKRLELFGGQDLEVVGSEKIRTPNACLPRDMVPLGDRLLFGYEVKLGLKQEILVDHVLGLYSFVNKETGFEFKPLSSNVEEGDTTPVQPSFLDNEAFRRDIKELFRYYKSIRLLQLRLVENGTRLLAVFQTGTTLNDVKVLRWAVTASGDEPVVYMDNRGEQDHIIPPVHEWTWDVAGRDKFVSGKYPHVSILDEVFVETVGGDLTVKVENNTEDGLGIYREKVEDARQSLADAQFHYKKLGVIILLKILPYRESSWRYLVFNTRTQTIHNVKAIGDSCLALPEDHGLIFPGGYYLQEGTVKTFDGDYDGMGVETSVRSPNGEDVLYVFRNRQEGRMALMAYNLIRKEVRPPIHCNGYALYQDGTLILFRASPDGEPSRVHTTQIWRTPFVSVEHLEKNQNKTGSYLEGIGNADLVRGVSDCLSIARRVEEQQPSLALYEDLVTQLNKVGDVYPWLRHAEVGNLTAPLEEIKKTATLVLEEFDKVSTFKKQAHKAFAEAESNFREQARKLYPDDWKTIQEFVDVLASLRTQRGHIISLKDMRYSPTADIQVLEADVVKTIDQISQKTIEFLLGETAFLSYRESIAAQEALVESLAKAGDALPLLEELQKIGAGLELLTDIIGSIKIEDATQRIGVLESISELMGQLNRSRALVSSRKKELGSKESCSEFGVQFQLLTQGVTSAINLADTPEKCEQALSRLMIQLEDLEGRFGEFDEFLAQLNQKREDIYKSVTSKKQTLLEARQRRVQQLLTSAERILDGIVRRAGQLKSNDDLNTYFASDAMVMKVREVCERLREINDPVKADELEARLKMARQDSGRSLRDRQELFSEGDNLIKFGKHSFSVNTEPCELTMVPRQVDRGGNAVSVMNLHITGTDFFEVVDHPELEAGRDFWDQPLVSETEQVYRAEYLAYCVLADAEVGRRGLSIPKLFETRLSAGPRVTEEGAATHPALLELVRGYALNRFDEGYDRGIHDVDATLILENLLDLYQSARHLRFSPRVRHAACLFWCFGCEDETRDTFVSQAMSIKLLQATFGPNEAGDKLAAEVSTRVEEFARKNGLTLEIHEFRLTGLYLVEDLGDGDGQFLVSGHAVSLRDAFLRHLRDQGVFPKLQKQLVQLRSHLTRCYELAVSWLTAFVETNPTRQTDEVLERWRLCVDEAASLLLTEGKMEREVSSANTKLTVHGLLGQHPRINNRTMDIRLEEFITRLEHFRCTRVSAFRRYQDVRHNLLTKERARMRLDEVAPKVMSAFVRNKLINQVYLPLLGNNLAKQMGSAGANKRTDQMGMLLLISPPGYGKTTLMEYVASKLGLIFVKINGPALGHAVCSLDPAEAPNATSRQEVEKINFALEIGNNVMLYLDDIQHTNPELLQKFISLCDAQRKIEGIWKGRTRTYDLKGKRFCVCMAGNPYTESGARFQIPDMLANRADTYNLGDVLSGKEDIFELSYLENSLTSNSTLAPLPGREPEDIYKLIRMAEGLPVPTNELAYNYSSVELDEILSIFKKLFKVQKILLKVNKAYIASAATDDHYRTEPPFKLQGSYRNMTKLTEKVVAVMNDAELEQLIDDHYTSEAQTLTTGAEQNLLKLAELRGRMNDVQRERWAEIKRGFNRRQVLGDDEGDPVARVTAVLSKLSEQMDGISDSIDGAAAKAPAAIDLRPVLDKLSQSLAQRPSTDLAPILEKLSQSLAQRPTDLAPVLEKLSQSLAQRPSTDLAPILEKIAAARPQADLGPSLEKLAQAMAQQSAPPSTGANGEIRPYLERLEKVLVHMAQRVAPAPPAPAPPPPDLTPYLAGLTQAMQRLAEHRPVVTAPDEAAPRDAFTTQETSPALSLPMRAVLQDYRRTPDGSVVLTLAGQEGAPEQLEFVNCRFFLDSSSSKGKLAVALSSRSSSDLLKHLETRGQGSRKHYQLLDEKNQVIVELASDPCRPYSPRS